jgi:hypothetical protein
MAVQLLDVTIGVLAELDYAVTSAGAVDLSRIPTLPGGGPRVTVTGRAEGP